ncbi:hypothetical protein ABZ816_40005 [Actinosynnema sp. NPDC047251]|uniref:Putative membrane protein n=1 Tax=Saccharothrix espanaensis (strain ATCC 51144 / DSM 44229 / JCM 9112 / NBRC 15066 / NRRL 15764) TaxID=1179773 RepID=K0JQ28_SACES|nr:hypothetical protein [Saccharothrix espanaensis]CCH29385.1 putative membrane protein [Saccharothrix espanaensis DSM 44229]
MNAILDRLTTVSDRAVVPFRDSTVAGRAIATAMARRTTGSYFWTLIILLPAAALLGVAASMVGAGLSAPSLVRVLVGVVTGAVYVVLADFLYFRLSR